MTNLQKHIVENSNFKAENLIALFECIDVKKIDLALTIALGLNEAPDMPERKEAMEEEIDCVLMKYNQLEDTVTYEYTHTNTRWFCTQETADKFAIDGDTWKVDSSSKETEKHTIVATFVNSHRSTRTCSLDKWLK